MAFVASIDFQSPDAPPAAAYVADIGQVYGRRNGYTYGWTAANKIYGFNPVRRASQNALNSFNTLVKGNDWEISVPNGLYNVYVSAGQSDRTGSSYRINVEGMRAISATPTDESRFVSGLVTVRVTDGKLTLSNAGRARDNRINFINISDASPAGLTVQTAGVMGIQLNWRDLTLYQAGIKIERSTDGENFEQIADIPGGGTQSYIDSDVSTHTTYTYRVKNYTYLGDSNSSAPASVSIADVIVHVSDFGARGDGIIDDAPAIQAALDSAPSGATVLLEPNLTYLLGTGLNISKTLNLEGQNAKLVLNQSNHPQNTTLRVASRFGATVNWTETIKAGATTVRAATDPKIFAPGDYIRLELGQDPYDPNEQHYVDIAKIVSNDGRTITFDRPVPYDITPGKFNNTLKLATRLVDGGSIKHVVFDRTSNAIVDQAIELSSVKNFVIEAISGRFSIAMGVNDSRDITVRNIRGTLEKTHPSAGRVLTAWQTTDLDLTDVNVTTPADAPIVFLESHTRETTISDIVITSKFTGTAGNNLFHFAGASYDTEVSNVTVHNSAPVLFVDGGGQPAEYHFSNIVIDGQVKYLPLGKFDNLRVGNSYYDASHLRTLVLDIPLVPNATPQGGTAFTGVIRSAKMRLTSSQGVQAIYLTGNTGNGIQALGLLKGNNLVTLDLAGFGTDYPLSTPANATKNYAYYTDGTVAAGTMLHMEFEYYVP